MTTTAHRDAAGAPTPAAGSAPTPAGGAGAAGLLPVHPEAGFGVYVHIPFCASRCHYCDFITYTGLEALWTPYAHALLTEAGLAVGGLAGPRPAVTSVFVGGGTPTLLPPAGLGRLLERLRALLPMAPGLEITVEANPETVDDRLASGLAAAGVTRVSMGAQSFDERVLRELGRTHGSDRVTQAVAALRRAGVRRLNLDLIFGSPSEDDASWSRTLEAACALGLDHVSAYALTIEPATKFGRMVAAGTMAAPADDVLADRYAAACSVLAAAGYAHYEVSNWARGPLAPDGIPAEASRHNLTYWRRGGYLGLGAGAHELTPADELGRCAAAGGVRRWNLARVPAYLAAVRAGRRPTAGCEELELEQARFETLALRLRTVDGLDAAAARALGLDLDDPTVAAMRDAGLLRAGPGLQLSERGMFLHGDIVSRLAA